MAGHVFISYSRRDSVFVAALAAHLRQAGLDVWLDSEIDLGERWLNELRHRIDTCAVFLVVMSPAAEESVWVTREIVRAQAKGRPIVPVLLAGSAFLQLGDARFEDLTGGRMPDEALLGRLRQLVATTPPPASTMPPEVEAALRREEAGALAEGIARARRAAKSRKWRRALVGSAAMLLVLGAGTGAWWWGLSSFEPPAGARSSLSAGPSASASASAIAEPSALSSAAQVSALVVTASAPTSKTDCTYTAAATITATGAATVAYTYVRDNAGPASGSVTFTSAGTKTVNLPVSAGHAAGTAWVELTTTSPNEVTQRSTLTMPQQCTPHGGIVVNAQVTNSPLSGPCNQTTTLEFTTHIAVDPVNIVTYRATAFRQLGYEVPQQVSVLTRKVYTSSSVVQDSLTATFTNTGGYDQTYWLEVKAWVGDVDAPITHSTNQPFNVNCS